MCGIVGVLDPQRGATPRRDRATARAHGERDGPARPRRRSGVWVDEEAGVGFGHRRLSIIDLSEHGAQPMVSADGRWVITYNGEIYDHQELAARPRRRRRGAPRPLRHRGAARGHRPLGCRTRRWSGSTACSRSGCGTVGSGRLTLARDRMGEKPLYYGTLGTGEVVFASTLDALRGPSRLRPRGRPRRAGAVLPPQVRAGAVVDLSRASASSSRVTCVDGRRRRDRSAPRRRTGRTSTSSARGVTFDGSHRRRGGRARPAAAPVGAAPAGRRRAGRGVPLGRDRQLDGGRGGAAGVVDRRCGPSRSAPTAADYDESSDARRGRRAPRAPTTPS